MQEKNETKKKNAIISPLEKKTYKMVHKDNFTVKPPSREVPNRSQANFHNYQNKIIQNLHKPSFTLNQNTEPTKTSNLKYPFSQTNSISKASIKQKIESIPLKKIPNINQTSNNNNNQPVAKLLKNSSVQQLNAFAGSASFIIKRNLSQKTLGNQLEYDQGFLRTTHPIPRLDPTKVSNKVIGNICAYGANTHQGLVRNYNEDRVSIILNILKPTSKQWNEIWPQCHFFSVYDGHGGSLCADYLRDNLHRYIVEDPVFGQSVENAINNACSKIEQEILKMSEQSSGAYFDHSGSCAVCALLVDKKMYVINVGDSRMVASFEKGKKFQSLTQDHKPSEEFESHRILSNGGKVYQGDKQNLKLIFPTIFPENVFVEGPHRVHPGRLSVSRTFGDPDAKLPHLGGNMEVVIARPDIAVYDIEKDVVDYIVLCCDGIFDKLTNDEVNDIIWRIVYSSSVAMTVHEVCSVGVEAIMNEALKKKSLDNLTVVIICFQSFVEKLNEIWETKGFLNKKTHGEEMMLSASQTNFSQNSKIAKAVIPISKHKKGQPLVHLARKVSH